MYALVSLPSGEEIPPIEELVTDRPKTWARLPLEWKSEATPTLVLIARLPEIAAGGMAYLFVA